MNKIYAGLIALALFAAPRVADAQGVPGTTSFTARVTVDGSAANGTFDFVLALYDAATGGNKIWEETHTAVSVDDGLVYLSMGSRTTLDATIFDGTALFLEVTFGTQRMDTRLAIQSVPYAFRAGVATTADTLGPLGPDDVMPKGDTLACANGDFVTAFDGETGDVICTTGLGATGPQGPAGPRGLQGDTGAQGPQGVPGDPGADGATGPQGPQGVPGADGATGPQGPQGVPGADGATGPQGAQGVPGADGATGPQGPQGVPGNPGADGVAGAQGVRGLPGADGADGATGPQGPQGLRGLQGLQGLRGIQGPPGAQGLPGTNGTNGADGQPGAPGADGVDGAQGPRGFKGDPGVSNYKPFAQNCGPNDVPCIANCPAGLMILGGGCTSRSSGALTSNGPLPSFDGWECIGSWELMTATAICATVN